MTATRSVEQVESWLSADPVKRDYYGDDPYFWEGWSSFVAAAGGTAAAHLAGTELRHVTFLVVKPEAVVGRKVGPILSFLAARGFRVVGAWPVTMGRHEVRSIWRYQFNALPVANIRVFEMMVGGDDLFLVGVEHGLAGGEPSAPDLLSRSKGSSADPTGRGSLRDVLGRPALLVSYVHTPDEPADVLRELAVLVGPRQQRRILAALLGSRQWTQAQFDAAASAVRATMTARYDDSPPHDLDPLASLRRIRSLVREHRPAALSQVTLDALDSEQVPPALALQVVDELQDAAELPRWDRILTAIQLVDRMRTGRDPVIGPPPAPVWQT